ncbi:Z1 domain-containing protein [Bacteroides acidifaciens]|uniref:Z1 domain-containing protein n=1 Tax=Bacteroides acidifaciens TaxID=85831 RepID=UPI00261F28F4|nr:Z1 domain-containing protein [Bacteroides acidifaciens]
MTDEKILAIADALLSDSPTYAELEETAKKILVLAEMEKDGSEGIDKDYVIGIISANRKIYQAPSSIMEDDEDGAFWLTQFRADSSCPFTLWSHYKKSLTLPAPAVLEIDKTTDKILDMLSCPSRPGNWYRAGLVVGHVQSGKTGNFVGLANKAMDVGYKIILVLTGMYNDLRSQTQGRIDKGAIGRITDPDDQNYKKTIGVGKYEHHPNILNLTSSKLKGDFGSEKTDIGGVLTSQDPTIMVCKKNTSILTNILRLFSQHGVIADDGLPIIPNIPLFVIDDEADSASINTKYDKQELSKINAKIRAILSLFERRCYVGYTATPYANIFIDPDPEIKQGWIQEGDGAKFRICKEDLFPKNFIVNLSAPSNYIGPNVLFGIPTVYDDEEKRELPIIEYIKEGDYLEEKGKGKKKKVLTDLPASLVEAVKFFFVSTALRRARGQKKAHSSMLINISQYIKKQDSIYHLVTEMVSNICDRIMALGDNPDLEVELRSLYGNKIIPSNQIICEDYPDWSARLRLPEWDAVRDELHNVAAKVRNEVRVIHSPTDDDIELNTTRLDYAKYENRPKEIDNGLYVIAIGGNTMARGITLEGLVVSYFFRSSNTFDTLMQMGRWFGYRDGYIDACRLYLDREIAVNFRNIAVATQRMRDDFDDMNNRGVKPRDYGLKVMRFPGVLEATARNKFGSAVKGRLSLNKTTLQAYKLFKAPEIIEANKILTLNFLGSLGRAQHYERFGVPSQNFFWEATGEQVVEFLKNFKTATEQMPANLITSYITRQIAKGNLVEWTVILANVTKNKNGKPVRLNTHGTSAETLVVGAATRGNNEDPDSPYYVANNAAVSGPSYESLDLTDEEYQKALDMTIQEWEAAKAAGKTKRKSKPTEPFANCAKSVRKKSKGLLLLYNMDFGDEQTGIFTYVLSLPYIDDKDEKAIGYEYMGNPNAFKVIDDDED